MPEIFANRILIVDDDKDTVNVLTKILESQGYDFVSAFNGKEAL